MDRFIRTINVIVFLSVILSIQFAYSGFHYIEVPPEITDQMMIEYNEDTRDMIMELIKEELSDCSPDEHAMVILTRDGEPIYSNMDREVIEKFSKEELIEEITGEKEDNDITFVFGGSYWTDDQKKSVYDFLYVTKSDDHGLTGMYEASEKLFGEPFFSDYTVTLTLDPGIPTESVWIPRLIYWNGVYFYFSDNDPELILKNWRLDPDPQEDNDKAVFAEIMYKIFLDCFYIEYDHFYEGMSRSAGTIMMNHFSQAYPNYNDLFHGQQVEERPGYVFYDNFNHPAISTSNPFFYGENVMSVLTEYRKQCANMAWYKAWESSSEGLLYSDFMVLMFYYGISSTIAHGEYKPPDFGELCKMADGAWYDKYTRKS